MKLTHKLLVLTGVTLALPSSVFAQTGPMPMQCASEITKYCADKSHEDELVRVCLNENRAMLSSDCQEALDTTGDGIRGGSTMMSTDEIAAKLKEQGYGDISKIEIESRKNYEVKTVDANGTRVELYVDGITGKVIRSELDD